MDKEDQETRVLWVIMQLPRRQSKIVSLFYMPFLITFILRCKALDRIATSALQKLEISIFGHDAFQRAISLNLVRQIQ
jgi:hypothetical protein